MTEMTLPQAFELALSHHLAGRLDVAMDLYQRILQADPNHAESLRLLGVALTSKGLLREGKSLIRRSVSLCPNNAVALHNLGSTLQMLGQIDEAIDCLNQSIGMDPGIPENFNVIGVAYRQKGMNREANESFRRAIQLRENYPEAHNNLGEAFHHEWRLDEAIECYRRALEISPKLAASHNNLGNAYKDQGRLKEAVESFRKAIECEPFSPKPYSNLILAMQYDPDYDDKAIRDALKMWSDALATPRFSLIRSHDNDPSPDRPLRIGFVSPDFRIHPVGRLMVPLLSKLNKSLYETFCYYDHTFIDDVTNYCRKLSSNWRFIHGKSDEEAASQIRADRIDILVDLTSHTGRNRLLMFAQKPAPVQATWLAYCGTTGLATMDYRLSDPLLDPPGSDLLNYAEKTEYIDAYWCYPVHGNTADPGPSPFLRNGKITFGCMNNLCKISPISTRAWREILSRLPDSRLILFAHEGTGRDLCRAAIAGGVIDPGRIQFVKHGGLLEYMEHYRDIDIALDPFPYNGGITTCDAMWMGVPVVSLVGKRAVSRVGLSLLTRVGMPELAAASIDEYVHKAVELAKDIPRLELIRRTLRDRMLRSPLMDSTRFAKDMENTLRRIWRNRRRDPIII